MGMYSTGMPKTNFVCDQCGKGFLRYFSKITSKEVFCCKACQNSYRTVHIYACEWCGVGFHRPVRLNQKARFCCRKCWVNWTLSQTPKNCICTVCKKPFHKYAAAIKKGEGKYCSMKCKKVGTSAGFLGIKSKHYYHLHKWRDFSRLECLKRDGYKCVKCNSTRHLVAHHIVPLKDGGKDSLDNLETMCNSCHARYHWFGT